MRGAGAGSVINVGRVGAVCMSRGCVGAGVFGFAPQVRNSKRLQILIRDILLPLGNKLNETSRRVCAAPCAVPFATPRRLLLWRW